METMTLAARILPILLFLASLVCLAEPEYTWFANPGGAVAAEADGAHAAAFDAPGSAQLFQVAKRTAFRHSKAAFAASHLEADVLLETGHGVKAWLYAKDKDGNWYQSEEEFRLEPGRRTRMFVRIDRAGRHMMPVGHSGEWNAQAASGMFEFGITLFADMPGKVKVKCFSLNLTGTRERLPLRILSWHMPDTVFHNQTFESRFTLSREYFNPFDPDEIQVDYEIEIPGGVPDMDSLFLQSSRPDCPDPFASLRKFIPVPHTQNLRFPAFYGQDFRRSLHFTRETVLPNGAPYWAFRMMPHAVGKGHVRLRILDRTGDMPEELISDWREYQAAESDAPGTIRPCPRDPWHYEYANGELYFPIGVNIHANTDQRSEFQFKWGHLPDRGTFDFDEYLDACGKGGINLVEVWMASWTYAMEWDAARPYYYGVGRYNMANAWKLDTVFNRALRNRININLVLDAHGKLSSANDQEWDDNPYNAQAAFAVANDGFLEAASDFWSHPRAIELNAKRNRYIMARWGGMSNLYAIELWSEVSITNNAKQEYNNGNMIAWHRRAAKDIQGWDQGAHLVSTHICGDSGAVQSFQKLALEVPEFTHSACNAYRNGNIHILDQMRRHGEDLAYVGIPLMIMEYGGTHMGGKDNNVRGDVHSGLWASLFTWQAGTPCLWWHDFIHIRNLYPHFQAFARFLAGLDMRLYYEIGEGPVLRLPEISLTEPDSRWADDPEALKWSILRQQAKHPLFRGFKRLPVPGWTDYIVCALNENSAFGWIYNRYLTTIYPDDPLTTDPVRGQIFRLDFSLPTGSYLLQWIDTLTGEPYTSTIVRLDGHPRWLKVPPYRIDTAFKLFPLPERSLAQ